MKASRVRAKLAAGKPAMGVALHLVDASVYEMVSLMGFDAIWMDLEHHGTTLETAGHLMRAARVGGADIVARPAKGEFMRMGRMLELGASGIMYPRCADAAEAEEVVRWAKFAPMGRRGVDGAGADMPYLSMPIEQYIREANEQTFMIVQLEDPSAVEQAEAIARVPGVDMLMLGPGDFSILSGVPGQMDHPLVRDALEAVARGAVAAGKRWAATCPSAEHARAMLDRGASLIFHMADIVLLKQGFEAIREQFAALGIELTDRLTGGGTE